MPFLIRQILITLLRKFVHLQSFTLSLVCRINQVLLAFQRFLSPPRHRTAKDYSRGTSTLFYGSSNDYSQLSNVNTSTLTIIHPSYDVLVSKNEPFCLFSAVSVLPQGSSGPPGLIGSLPDLQGDLKSSDGGKPNEPLNAHNFLVSTLMLYEVKL